MTPNAKYQAAYRARCQARYVRRGEALAAIIAVIGEPHGSKERTILALATDGLADPKLEKS